MKPKTAPETGLTPATARKALQYDLANLLRRVKSGQPLTRYQRQLVEEKLHAPGGAAVPTATFAANQSELARVLGTSRQLVAFHAKKPDSPGRREDGRYPVGEWREYLAVNGRIPIAETPAHAGPSYGDICDFAAQRGLERACTVLPIVIGEGLAGKLPAQEIASLVSQTWAALATRLTGFLCSDGPRSVPMETPRAILEMCAKVGVPVPQGIDIGLDDGTEQ